MYDEALNKLDDGGVYIKPSVPKPSAPNATWIRLYSGGVNVRWFGARGVYTSDRAAIQKAIDYVYTNNIVKAGEVILPQGVYHIDSALITYSSITLRGIGSPVLEWTGTHSSAVYLLEINPSDTTTTTFAGFRLVVDNVIFRGNASFSAAGYVTNLYALKFATSAIEIRNCGFHNFDRTTKFDSNSYLIAFTSCAFRANNYGFHYDYSGLENSGENISITNSIISDNNYGIYNNLGGVFINNSSIDYNLHGHIAENITGSGGVNSLQLTIDNCHIEASNAAVGSSTVRMKNSELLVINNSILFDDIPDKYFSNSDSITIENTLMRISEGKYLANGGYFQLGNNLTIAHNMLSRITSLYSGIRNGSFESGLIGWTIDTVTGGTNAAVTNVNTYDSTNALRLGPGSTSLGSAVLSDFHTLPPLKTQGMLSVPITKADVTGMGAIRFYDESKTYITHNFEPILVSGSLSMYKVGFTIPINAAYFKIFLKADLGTVTNYLYCDDLYINFY